MNNIAVIGSGLSAIGSIKFLIEKGIKPVVIDFGLQLPHDKKLLVEALRSKGPTKWNAEDRALFNSNNRQQKSLPRKKFLGSDYFYGDSVANAPLKYMGSAPPLSYAQGGLSIGWGAAVLPPKASDISDWPIKFEELLTSIQQVLKDTPFCAEKDELELEFPLLSSEYSSIKQSISTQEILYRLRKKLPIKKNRFVYGAARLLLDSNSENSTGCLYCGECMSGCVFGSIYKADASIKEWIRQNKIVYLNGLLVSHLVQTSSSVEIHAKTSSGSKWIQRFQHVFLGAGAVNSFRIIAQSRPNQSHKAAFASVRGGYIVPILTFKRLKLSWPNTNTMPSIFIESKPLKHSKWIHIQLSLENELFRRKVTGLLSKIGLNKPKVINFILSHLYIAFVNLHSDYAGCYHLKFHDDNNKSSEPALLRSKYIKSGKFLRFHLFLWFEIVRIFSKIGCFPLIFAKIKNTSSYHVASTLPMQVPCIQELTTDSLGKPYGFSSVHVIDTSTFPSIPGTTIGLLAMANAYRITSKVIADSDKF